MEIFYQVFEHTAERYPNHIAISSTNKTISYAMLNDQANQLAHYLIEKKLPAETRIGVYLNPSVDLIVSLLATMKAGLVYVPLNTDQEIPTKRLLYQIDNAETALILSDI